MDAYSMDLRERVVTACDDGTETREEVAERFGVSTSFIRKLLRRRRQSGSVSPKPHAGGVKPTLKPKDLKQVRTLVRQQPDATKQRTFVVLGSGDAARPFFKSRGLLTSEKLDELSPDTHLVVVWNATHLTEAEKQNAKVLCDFAGRGGRVIVLSTPSWNWSQLCDVTIGKAQRFSRVFPHKDVQHPMLTGIDPQWLIRWNGLPGTVGLGRIEGATLARAKKILWARDTKTTTAAALPAAVGNGSILFIQLDLQRRLDPSKPNYDPVAERILINVLGLR